jgi:hypothetical protein
MLRNINIEVIKMSRKMIVLVIFGKDVWAGSGQKDPILLNLNDVWAQSNWSKSWMAPSM